MKVFFLCRTGRHTSLLAAALYLGIIKNRTGSTGEIKNTDLYSINGFDAGDNSVAGKPFFVGVDSSANEVYTIGVHNEGSIMVRAANDFISLMGIERGEWCVVDTSPLTSGWTTLGYCLKRVGVKSLARLFFGMGARREMAGLLKLVNEKRKLFGYPKSA